MLKFNLFILVCKVLKVACSYFHYATMKVCILCGTWWHVFVESFSLCNLYLDALSYVVVLPSEDSSAAQI